MASTLTRPGDVTPETLREHAAHEVTIVIAAYGNLPYLPAAIQSALHAPAAAVMIADDASGPDERRVFAHFEELHRPRLRVIRSERQRGIATNLNEAIRRVRTPFFVRLDCDDVLYPGHVEAAFRLLTEHPALAAVAGKEYRIAGDDCLDFRLFPAPKHNADPNPRILLGEDAFRFAITWAPNACSSGTVYRKAAFDDVGGFNPRVPWGEDWEIWFRLARKWELAYIDSPSALYRVHAGATTSLYQREERICYGYDWMYRRAAELCPYPDLRALLRRKLLRVTRLYAGAAWRDARRGRWASVAHLWNSARSFVTALRGI